MDKKISTIVWTRKDQFEVLDALPKYADEIIDFLKEHYITTDVFCKYLNLTEDSEAIEAYAKLWKKYIEFKECIVLLQENGKRVLRGVSFVKGMSAQDISWYFVNHWGNEFLENLSLLEKELFTIAETHNNPLIPKIEQIKEFLYILFICLHPGVKGGNLKKKFLESAYKYGQRIKYRHLLYVTRSANDAIRAEKFGMLEMAKLFYGDFKNISGIRSITKIIGSEHFAKLYWMPIEPIEYTVPEWILKTK